MAFNPFYLHFKKKRKKCACTLSAVDGMGHHTGVLHLLLDLISGSLGGDAQNDRY